MFYFASTILISAFLIFQVQPMIARIILPWFGGASSVWSTVQMFFQILLTGGYAYANWLSRPGKGRLKVHLGFLAFSLLLLTLLSLLWRSPITPGNNWKPGPETEPILEIIMLLFISVGLPYFILSSNSPLLQSWFHQEFPQKTAYKLYAISNIGSLVGLISYPVLVEPALPLIWQGRVWSILYLIYVVLIGGKTIKFHKKGTEVKEGVGSQEIIKSGPAWQIYVIWIALAAAASILLLATTSQITQEIAVIPFLWVIPLTIYLLSFILAFSGERYYSRQFYLVMAFVTTILFGWVLGRSEDLNVIVQIGAYSFALFTACMVCHGELFRLRPHPSQLTFFYLMVSIGGAVGGIFITFLAPKIFNGYWELPLGMAFFWMVFLTVSFINKRPGSRWLFVLNNVLLVSSVVFSFVRAGQFITADVKNSLFLQRSFYGVIRVKSLGDEGWPSRRYALVHGLTIHGIQYVDEEKRDLPTAYYAETGGGGLAILNHPRYGQKTRVGVLGLGIGTLAAYGQEGDLYRFYEINPDVITLAEGAGGFFSYLEDSRASIEIVPGDARLSLEQELTMGLKNEYHVLVLDVFSSDSIPAHLMNREAFDLYLKNLASDGILAVHISNRHLDLMPVVWGLADHFELARVVISDPGNYESVFPSLWVLLSRQNYLLENQEIISHAKNMENYSSSIRLWTDDYSNLFQILK